VTTSMSRQQSELYPLITYHRDGRRLLDSLKHRPRTDHREDFRLPTAVRPERDAHMIAVAGPNVWHPLHVK
jgi:hypothetical protein